MPYALGSIPLGETEVGIYYRWHRKRRRGRFVSPERAMKQLKDFERDQKTKLLKPGTQETVRIFLSLEAETRIKAFRAYKILFGEKKAEYLRMVYAKWQAGSVKISKDMQERLLQYLPPLLSFQDKYKIIEAMWKGSRRQDLWYLSLSTSSQIAATVEGMQFRMKQSREGGLPVEIGNTLSWLTEGDAELALKMIEMFGQEEDSQIAEVVGANLKGLQEFLLKNEAEGAAYREVNALGLRVMIHMKRGDEMSDAERHLALRSDGQAGAMVRIEKPHDLLGEALKQLSPEQAREILGTAANAALSLQIKNKQAELDLAIAKQKLDNVTANARDHTAMGRDFDLTAEHRDENGYTRITVKKEHKRGFLSWLLG
jgi:hypothetical protein